MPDAAERSASVPHEKNERLIKCSAETRMRGSVDQDGVCDHA